MVLEHPARFALSCAPAVRATPSRSMSAEELDLPVRTPLGAPPLAPIQGGKTLRRLSLISACAWTLFILVVCWTPQNRLPVNENRVPILKLIHADKMVHATVFAVFGALWMHALGTERRAAWVVLAGVLLAIVTEAGQGLMPIGRTADLLDALADMAGTAASVLVYARYISRS